MILICAVLFVDDLTKICCAFHDTISFAVGFGKSGICGTAGLMVYDIRQRKMVRLSFPNRKKLFTLLSNILK